MLIENRGFSVLNTTHTNTHTHTHTHTTNSAVQLEIITLCAVSTAIAFVNTHWTNVSVAITGALKSRDLTMRHQSNRSQRVEHLGPKKKLNVLNDKRIKFCLSRFDSSAYSRLQFLRAVSYSVGAHTESLQPRDDDNSSSSSEDEVEDRQAPVPAATTSGASESATAAAATTSDDCCELCLMAARAGFALVLCGSVRFC